MSTPTTTPASSPGVQPTSDAQASRLGTQLARDALGTLGLRIASSVFALAAALLLARLLGATRYGAYAWAVAWVTVLSIPATLGMERLLVRNIAAYAMGGDWGALRGLLRRSIQWVLATSLLIGLMTALVSIFVDWRHPALRDALLAALLMLPMMSMISLYQGGLQGFRRVVVALAPEQILRPLLFIGLVVVLRLRQVPLGAVEAVLLQVAATFAGFAVTWRLFARTLPTELRTAAPTYASRTWSTSAVSMLVISAVVLIYARLDVIMLGALRGAKAAGIYSSAVSAASMILLPLGAANMALAPLVPRLYAARRERELSINVRRISRIVFAATAVAALTLGILASPTLGLFGGEFRAGAAALQVLLLAQTVTAFSSTSVMLLTMTDNEHAAAAWIAAAALLNVVLDVALIPPWGLVGSSIATLAASAVQMTALSVLVRRRLGIDSTVLGLTPR
jgi:O-antigen/teichoic acid export membrane protein